MRFSPVPHLIALLLCPVLTQAQEIQVPLDREGKIQTIDVDLERKLGLFTTYKNFREARLFQASDTSYILEITYEDANRTMKTRLPLTTAAVESLRSDVSLRITEQAPEVTLNHEGRAWMIIESTALSLGFYGWAVPVILDIDDGKTFVALYMLTSGAGFFIPLALTNSIDVTDANAILYAYGGTRGILHGVMLNELLYGKETTARGGISMATLASIGESIGGFVVAKGMSGGKASTISVCGDFGLGLSLGASGLLDFYNSGQERSLAATILLGSAAGLGAGNLLANDQPYTRGDAFILEATGLLGAFIPIAALDLTGVKDGKTYTAVSMAGGVAGLALAHASLLRGRDFTTGQGLIVQLGTLGGALTGIGMAYLLSSNGADETLFLTSSTVGAFGGFALTYNLFSKEAQTAEKGSSWDLHLLPVGLLSPLLDDSRFSMVSRVPLVSLECRF